MIERPVLIERDEIIARLRESKAEEEDVGRGSGYRFGQEWAELNASYSELIRAVRAATDQDVSGRVFEVYDDTPIACHFAGYIAGFNGKATREVAEFWEGIVGEEAFEEVGMEPMTEIFCKSFLSGALSVWELVSAEVEAVPTTDAVVPAAR